MICGLWGSPGDAARPRERVAERVFFSSFGPVCLDRSSLQYGHITTTPKPGWSDADVVGRLAGLAPVTGFDTDVNAPALLEAQRAGLRDLCYVTVGTGVGVGAVVNGAAVHGHSHPEAGKEGRLFLFFSSSSLHPGHVPVALLPSDAGFAGHCPFHGARCAEGVLRVSALAARAGVAPRELAAL
jgi:fructokinase